MSRTVRAAGTPGSPGGSPGTAVPAGPTWTDRIAWTARSANSARAPARDPEALDWRLVPVALAAWAGALVGLWAPGAVVVGVVVALALVLVLACLLRRPVLAVVLVTAAGAAVSGAAALHVVHGGPVAALVQAGAAVSATGEVRGDPVRRPSAFDPTVQTITVPVRLTEVTARGRTTSVRTPVLVVSEDPAWADLLAGQRVQVEGLLRPGIRLEVAGVLRTNGPPDVRSAPSLASRATEPLRAGLRTASATALPPGHALVPGLVVGDEGLVSEELTEAMRTAGLTHLTAVSGTNVTVVVVCVLALARLVGVRGYALPVLGLLAVVGFVLLARPEPSVVRAGVMGSVAVLGVLLAGRRRGLPSLATAVVALLVVDPWLARSAGFALSVLATAAILLLVPWWRDRTGWLPPSAATVVAVPIAAQVACLPVLAAISDELSVVAVPANLLAAPAVAPATVLGAAAAVVAPAVPWLAAGLAWLASIPAGWIALVAEHAAAVPGAALDWWPGPPGVAAAAGVSVVALVVVPWVLARWWTSAAAAVVAVLVLGLAPTPGWPPPGWQVVACDVGQGDAFVLRAGPDSAVVVDTGPDPGDVGRCLDSLGVQHVPLLVLTHDHADHAGGLAGVLRGRTVERALVSPLDPAIDLRAAGVPVQVAEPGVVEQVGTVRLEVLWPVRVIGTGGEATNNSSVVLRATSTPDGHGEVSTRGTTTLLTGDLEPGAQRALVAGGADLRADVLKVAHHGSAHQHPGLLDAVRPRVALIGVGGENTFGHPAPSVLAELNAAGVEVHRTDQHGSVAVVVDDDGGLAVQRDGPRTRGRVRRRGVRRSAGTGRMRDVDQPAEDPVEEIEFAGETLRLGQLLQLAGLAESGSHARTVLAEYDVRVNGEPDDRRGRQLRPGDVVEALGRTVRVRSGSTGSPGSPRSTGSGSTGSPGPTGAGQDDR